MPAYAFDFTTAAGAQRLQFTLDDDRPLAPQLFQVHEELRQRGLILAGGPDDEIGAFWNGVDLDQTKTPKQLSLSPIRPIELRLRPPPQKAPRRAPEAPIRPFMAKGWGVAALAGFFGALVAWVIASGFVDLGEVVDDYAQLDGVVAVLLGMGVGAMTLGAEAWRESRNPLLGALTGFGAGAIGGFLGAMGGGALRGALGISLSPLAFLATRVGAWALLGGALGAAVALPAVRRDGRRIIDGLVFGLGAGAVGGLVYCFPGPSDGWQLAAFVLVGCGVSVGVTAPALQRSAAILELERAGHRPVGVLTLREWALDEQNGAQLSSGGASARVEWKGGRFAILPTEGSANVVVSGLPINTAIYLRNYDLIELGEMKYRFRRLRQASV
jgi:hypothetical protein